MYSRCAHGPAGMAARQIGPDTNALTVSSIVSPGGGAGDILPHLHSDTARCPGAAPVLPRATQVPPGTAPAPPRRCPGGKLTKLQKLVAVPALFEHAVVMGT